MEGYPFLFLMAVAAQLHRCPRLISKESDPVRTMRHMTGKTGQFYSFIIELDSPFRTEGMPFALTPEGCYYMPHINRWMALKAKGIAFSSK